MDERRLLAILFTDVVGYTTLTERDEAAAMRVRERHRTLVRALANQFEGEMIDSTGDEALAVFPTALLAVDCALALQASLRDDRELVLRIGIHLGDTVRRGPEVIGEGVNVAARIRPLAEPGGIAVSESVYQAIRTRPYIHATSLGAQALKNVSAPVNVFAVTGAAHKPQSSRSRRRLVIAVVAAFVVVIGGWVVWSQYRVSILASFALAAPKYFSNPVQQQLGFTTTSDDVHIAYATTGSGPPVIFVLGWGTHLEQGMMSPLYDRVGWIAQISEQSRLVRYDGRGFGLSQRDVTDFSIDARVRDIEAVADALHLERFAIYAISAGGPAAIAYTVRHPERVTRLLLAETYAGSAALPRSAAETVQMDGMIRLMGTSWDSPAVRDMWLSFLEPSGDDVGRRAGSELLRRSGSGTAMAGFFTVAILDDVSSQAREIRVPTLVIHGDLDVAVRPEYGIQLASLIPGARLEILKGANHFSTGGDSRLIAFAKKFLAEDATGAGKASGAP